MSFRLVVLSFFMLLLTGCASFEEPRWLLLGDSDKEAFFMDRQQVQRLPDGTYRYPVKISPYLEGQPHRHDDNRDTNQQLTIEIDCRNKQWLEAEHSVIDQNNKVLFQYLNSAATTQAIETDSIHFAAYKYLCSSSDIIAQHNH